MSKYPRRSGRSPTPGRALSDAPDQISRRGWLTAAGAALATAVGTARGAFAQSALPAAESATDAATIRLSLNENSFGCSPRVVRAVRDGLIDLNRYVEAEAGKLTAQIAAREAASSGQIIVGEILQLLGTRLSLAGGPGGEFIYSTPGFTELIEAAEAAGGIGIPIPLDSSLRNDLAAIAARVDRRTRAVFIVNPHNPSGTVCDALSLETFVREVSRRTLVIVDEAYLEYTADFRERTLATRVRAGDNAVVFRTFGKIYGLAGLPLDYALVPAALAENLRRFGAGDPHALNRLAVKAASIALEDDRFVHATRDSIATERARWHAALDRLALHRAAASANFVFFETGLPHEQVAAAFRAHRVDIGRAFPPLDHWARITIGRPDENSVALDALAEIFAGKHPYA